MRRSSFESRGFQWPMMTGAGPMAGSMRSSRALSLREARRRKKSRRPCDALSKSLALDALRASARCTSMFADEESTA